MSLVEREKKFEEMTSRFQAQNFSSLIAGKELPPYLFERLQLISLIYLSSCFQKKTMSQTSLIMNEVGLLKEFDRRLEAGEIKNVTPNGMVVPKRGLNFEYNLFVAAVADVISALNISDLIAEWVSIPSLRFKGAVVSEEKLARNYASEHPHTEAWIPLAGPYCISMFIPILGDCERNSVAFYAPPSDFKEEWLNHQASYTKAAAIAERYRKLDVPYRKGMVYFAECATMHRTVRSPGAAARASLDVGFFLKNSPLPEQERKRPTQKMIGEVGTSKMLVFKDSIDQIRDTAEAKNHPSDEGYELIDLI